MRSFNLDDLVETMSPYLPIADFDPRAWLDNHRNLCLTDDLGNFALFEYETKGVYSGHYFFKARGRSALDAAKILLKEAFMNGYGVQVIRGFTPLEHLGARWMNKQLGFKGYGVVNTSVGPMELVILTKKEYLDE